MEKVYEELDEAKAEIGRLREEQKAKTELCESLKRAHNEQLAKIREASDKIEKLARQLNEKVDEISITKQMYEELKSSMKEKEAIIKRLSSANDKLRITWDEKLVKWERENTELIAALDEASSKNMDQEQKLCACMEENRGLKSLLSASDKKCLEIENKAKESKELRLKDDMLLKLEEEIRKVEYQLKWKKEQFRHLEEAHEKLRGQLQASKKEWELEKSSLLDEISTLQTNLDYQTRISEGLQRRLQMCNQALAHEESRRKYMEVQLSETKTRFDNVFAECEEAISKIECLTNQRDKDVASLRDSLGTKEMIHKEMAYQVGRLEQENRELRLSLKELQEAQIQEAGTSSSLSKLRNKLKGLEQMHRDCSKNLRAKEAEWTSEFEKMAGDLRNCRSELESKDMAIKELKIELEVCHSLIMHLELQNEESSMMLMVLKSGICETQLKLENEMADMHLKNCKREEEVSLLMKQLEMKSAARTNASLRDLLGTKEMILTEMEYQVGRLEQDNGELRLSLKELQEAQIQEVGTSSSLSKLQNKLKGLEQMHRDCSKNLRAKEAEWTSEFEKMEGDLRNCRSELELKMDTAIKELKMELEVCHSLIMHLELQNEESSIMLLVLKSGIWEARLKLANEMADMDLKNCEREKEVSLLMKQLEMKSAALTNAQKDITEHRGNMASLLSKVESLSFVEQQQLQLQDELERHKELLKESSGCQLCLKEQASQMELELVYVHAALNRANGELFEKFCEGNELEFESQIWKSTAERLKANLEQNQQLRKQVEVSLLAQIEVEVTLKQEKASLGHALEDKERRIEDLERQLVLLDRKLKTREAESVNAASTELKKEENALHGTKEKESISNGLHKEIDCLEQECMRIGLEGVILAHIKAERTYKHQKDNFHELVEERDRRIDDLHQLSMSLEEKFKSSTASFSSQLAEKQAELNLLHKAWEKIATDEVLKEFEIQEKIMVIAELGDGFSKLKNILESQQKTLSSSKEEREEVAAELKAKQLEVKKLTSDIRTSETTIGRLESEKRTLLEDLKKLMSDREILLDLTRSLSERISKFCVEDMQLMGVWEKIVQKFDENRIGMDLKGDDDLFDTLKENKNIHPSFLEKRAETGIVDERSPFRVLNN